MPPEGPEVAGLRNPGQGQCSLQQKCVTSLNGGRAAPGPQMPLRNDQEGPRDCRRRQRPSALTAAHPAPFPPHSLPTVGGYGDPGLWDSRALRAFLFLLGTCCHLGAGTELLPGPGRQDESSSCPLACLPPSRTFPEHLQGAKDYARCLEYDNEQPFLPGSKEEAGKSTGGDETMD